MLVHQLIFQGPDDKIALYEKSAKFSYAQIQTRVAQYRDYLYAHGVRARDNVALFAKNSGNFVFSYMAIISLGGVVVPLNTMLISREISFILKDAHIKHVVTDKELDLSGYFDECSDQPIQILIPKINEEISRSKYPDAPMASIQDSAPCAILYTSGTTGRPKGALLSHGNLLSNTKALAEVLHAKTGDNFLCVLPMFHSFGWTCSVLTPLFKGASVTIVETFSPKEVIATIRNQRVTVVLGVPAMYSFYASLAKPEDLAGVRLFASGGASLPIELINKFHAMTKQRVIEGYGLSEASPAVCFNPIQATKPSSIGLPLPSVKVKIVDDDGKEMGPREIGELIIQGPNVMLGYYGLREESDKALRGGWLHTGDLAYKDEEGYIFIVDRKKDMIIVSGLNVYPKEVEEILYQHPTVKDAAVVGVPDKKRGEFVRAFVVVNEGMEFNKKELMNFLKANLANYKLPREIIELETFPRNAMGKILKKELKLFTKKKN